MCSFARRKNFCVNEAVFAERRIRLSARTLEGNALSLEPDTQLSEYVVNEARIARVVSKPAHNAAVGMSRNGIDIWPRTHGVPTSGDLNRCDGICRVPPNDVNLRS